MKVSAQQLEKMIREAIGEMTGENRTQESDAKHMKKHLSDMLMHLQKYIDAAQPYHIDRLHQVDSMISDAINLIAGEGPATHNAASYYSLKEARGEGSEVGTGVPDGEKIASFMKSFDKLIEDTILKTRELADKGEDLIQANLLNHPESGVRNEFLKHKVGMLRSMANNLATVFERVKRFSP